MKLTRASKSKIARTLAIALAGGSMFSACDTRFKQGVVSGTESFLYNTLLNPSVIVNLLVPSEAADGE